VVEWGTQRNPDSKSIPKALVELERRRSMNVYIVLGIILIVALIGNLLVAYQMKDRLDKIAELMEKK
jgi:hypothetical protein